MFLPAKVRVALVGLVVAGGAASAAVLGPAGLAVGQSSPPAQAQIQLNSPATLVLKGAAVDVSVTASCSGPLIESGTVFISLTENVEGNIATGDNEAGIDCTGTSQTIEVLVPANVGFVFKRGSAIANAAIEACNATQSSCAGQQIEPTIKIGK
jgi:hypothetical protein